MEIINMLDWEAIVAVTCVFSWELIAEAIISIIRVVAKHRDLTNEGIADTWMEDRILEEMITPTWRKIGEFVMNIG